MAMGDDNYQTWLTKTATEIIYWTAAQPNFIHNNGQIEEVPAFTAATQFDHTHQCYVKHILATERIDQTLYPEEDTEFDYHSFGRHRQITGEKFLGLDLCIFPWTSLLKGLPHLFCQMIKQSNNAHDRHSRS